MPKSRPAATPAIELPAGTYYIGDPCYMMNYSGLGLTMRQKVWDAQPEGERYAHFDLEHEGARVIGFGTGGRDGGFPGTDGHEYGCDAAALGIASEEATRRMEAHALFACRKVTFEAPFQVRRDARGVLHFGAYRIPIR